ncbi:DUF2071 domain-containing protein [Alicyclobacillus curvatus]|nr:DUF2071 domain-containing protein [Alicyclobacillus curvatus]
MKTSPENILQITSHRPYPLPSGPWVMRQTWNRLLFAHWPLPPGLLEPLIPQGLKLDTFDNKAYVSVLPFEMTNVRMRLLPAIPGASQMQQINIRTYVLRDNKPGVYFLALDTNHLPTVWLTRLMLGLPYHHAQMNVKSRFVGSGREIEFSSQRLDATGRGKTDMHAGSTPSLPLQNADSRSRLTSLQTPRRGGTLQVSYQPSSDIWHAKPGSLDHWLTERYCLYTVNAGKLLRVDIHHQPWPLQFAKARFRQQTLLTPLKGKIGFELPLEAPILHYAHRIDALLWLARIVR